MNRNDSFIPDVLAIPLNPRPSYDALITAGQPRAFGRIIALSDDKRTARVVWRGASGCMLSRPMPGVHQGFAPLQP